MRLGKEDEPYQELELAYNNGYRDAATVNSLRLLDSYKNFDTFRDDTTIHQAQQERNRRCCCPTCRPSCTPFSPLTKRSTR